MRPADQRLQSVGATFAVHYYTTLVQAPETLAALYTANANVVHRFQKANGAAEISSLLTTVTAVGVTEVKLEDVSTTRTTSGGLKVSITGLFISHDAEQAFTQEVEMRELESNVFGITSDKLSYAAAAAAEQTAWAAAEAPQEAAEKAAEEKPAAAAAAAPAAAEEEKKVEEKPKSRKATPAPAPAPAAAAEPAKKPASFAEALKMKKAADGAAFSNKAVRVVASDAVEQAQESKKQSGNKKEEKAAEAAEAKQHSHEDKEAAAVVFFDIILKELSAEVTEEEVRAIVSPVAAVKLVNIVKSEKRRRNKESEAAAPTITFAFVQLDRPAEAEGAAEHVAEVVAKLSEQNKALKVEAVREKKKPHAPRNAHAGGAAAAAAKKPQSGGNDGARGRKRGEHGASGPAANRAKPAAAKAEKK